MDEIAELEDSPDDTLFVKGKRFVFRAVKRLGFFGILMFASVRSKRELSCSQLSSSPFFCMALRRTRGPYVSLQIPNPLFDLAGLTCGTFLIPFWTFFGATAIGKAFVKVPFWIRAYFAAQRLYLAFMRTSDLRSSLTLLFLFPQAHLQTVFVIVMFSKELLQYWISLVERVAPFLKGTIDEFLQEQKAKFHRAAGAVVEAEVRPNALIILCKRTRPRTHTRPVLLHVHSHTHSCFTEEPPWPRLGLLPDGHARVLLDLHRELERPGTRIRHRRGADSEAGAQEGPVRGARTHRLRRGRMSRKWHAARSGHPRGIKRLFIASVVGSENHSAFLQ